MVLPGHKNLLISNYLVSLTKYKEFIFILIRRVLLHVFAHRHLLWIETKVHSSILAATWDNLGVLCETALNLFFKCFAAPVIPLIIKATQNYVPVCIGSSDSLGE